MLKRLSGLHRFFLSQSLYPLILASFLSMVLFILRVLYSHVWHYANLPWNLFLAWLPYVFSFLAASWQRWFPKGWLMLPFLAILWLIFFPNAPYIVTDFYHLVYRPPVPLWFDIGLIACFAFAGCFLAVTSLRTMQELVEMYLGRWIGWLFVLISLVLSGFGIYLGRFVRFNSWDLFSNPRSVLREVAVRLANPQDHLRFVGFTLMFTAILLVFYLTFVSMSHRTMSKPLKEFIPDKEKYP